MSRYQYPYRPYQNDASSGRRFSSQERRPNSYRRRRPFEYTGTGKALAAGGKVVWKGARAGWKAGKFAYRTGKTAYKTGKKLYRVAKLGARVLGKIIRRGR